MLFIPSIKLQPFINMDIQNTKKIILKKLEFFINWSMYITFVSKIEKSLIKEKRNNVIIIKDNLFLGD